MRKLIVCCVLLAMVLSFSGCGRSDGEWPTVPQIGVTDPSVPENTTEPTEPPYAG